MEMWKSQCRKRLTKKIEVFPGEFLYTGETERKMGEMSEDSTCVSKSECKCAERGKCKKCGKYNSKKGIDDTSIVIAWDYILDLQKIQVPNGSRM